MPQAVIAALVAAGVETVVAEVIVAVAEVVISAAASSLLSSKAKPSNQATSADASGRQQMVRSAIANRPLVYGEVRLSGPIVYASVNGGSPGDPNSNMNLVIALTGHEVDSIGSIFFNNIEIPPGSIGPDGGIIAGSYNNAAIVRRHTGAPGQVVDALLSANDSNWTAAHRGDGVANLVAILSWNPQIWATGLPNISAIVRGKKCFDPRDSGTRWTQNAALCIRDYLTNADYGLGCDASEIDDDAVITAANICDERASGPVYANAFTADVADNLLDFALPEAMLLTGSGVQLTTTGTLPAPLALATTYYFINLNQTTAQLATSVDNAAAGIAITLTDAGSGAHQVNFFDQPRYQINGTIDTGSAPLDILGQLVAAMGGQAVYSGGKWQIYAGAYIAPVGTLGVSDLAGRIQLTPRPSRQNLFNAVQGTYVSPFDSWQPVNFPTVSSATYQAQDGGVQILTTVNFPFEIDGIRAQRLAKLTLEKSRLSASCNFPAKFTAFQWSVPDNLQVTIPQLGWAAKEFSVQDWRFSPAGAVSLMLQEEAAEAYQWLPADGQVLLAAPQTNFPDPLQVGMPGNPLVTESLYQTSGSAGVKSRVTVTWAAAPDSFVNAYEAQYKAHGDIAWLPMPSISLLVAQQDDITTGDYDFRVRATNVLGVHSGFSSVVTEEILGLVAPPADPTGFSVVASNGAAIGTWDATVDLDVRQGGNAVVRHSPLTSGAGWGDGYVIKTLAGSSTNGTLPLMTGTYMLKWQDSTGHFSDNFAAFVATEGMVTGLSTIATITEDPSFSGTKTGTTVVSSQLELGSALTWDSNPGNVDTWGDVDLITGGILAAGTYAFANKFDGTTVATRRFQAGIKVSAFDIGATIDARSAFIDTWDDFDGMSVNDCDATLYAETTNDDPASGGAVWNAPAEFTVADFNCRGARFTLHLESGNPSHNIAVINLAVTVKA